MVLLNDALNKAVQANRIENANYLIDKKADINSVDLMGCTPLITALKFDHTDMAEFLVNQKADLNVGTKYGETPLQFDASQGKLSMVKLFLDNIEDNDAKDNQRKIALGIAQSFGHNDVVMFLLKDQI